MFIYTILLYTRDRYIGCCQHHNHYKLTGSGGVYNKAVGSYWNNIRISRIQRPSKRLLTERSSKSLEKQFQCKCRNISEEYLNSITEYI